MPLFSPDYVLTSNYSVNSAILYSSSTSSFSQTLVSVNAFQIEDAITFSRIDMPISMNVASTTTTNTAAMRASFVYGIYTASGSTLSPVVANSASSTFTWASNSNFTGLTGPRMLSFDLSTALTPGNYFFALQVSTSNSVSSGAATTALGCSMIMIFGTQYSVLPFQDFNSNTNASVNRLRYFHGINTVSISATSQTMQLSQMLATGTAYVRANNMLIFRGV